MGRFIAQGVKGPYLILASYELEHIKALRLKEGDTVEVLHKDKLYRCQIATLGKGEVFCEILEELPFCMPKPSVVLYQCVPTHLSTMDEIVDKVSQAGAERLVPVISKRSFQRLEAILERYSRWERIALSAFKQCKRPLPLRIDKPVRIEDIRVEQEVALVFDNFQAKTYIKDVPSGKESYALLVGPEGGLTQEEVALLIKKGFLAVRLRPYILRVETASTVGVALVMNLFGQDV